MAKRLAGDARPAQFRRRPAMGKTDACCTRSRAGQNDNPVLPLGKCRMMPLRYGKESAPHLAGQTACAAAPARQNALKEEPHPCCALVAACSSCNSLLPHSPRSVTTFEPATVPPVEPTVDLRKDKTDQIEIHPPGGRKCPIACVHVRFALPSIRPDVQARASTVS